MVAKSSERKANCIYCNDTGHTLRKLTVSGCCPFCIVGKRASTFWWAAKKKAQAA